MFGYNSALVNIHAPIIFSNLTQTSDQTYIQGFYRTPKQNERKCTWEEDCCMNAPPTNAILCEYVTPEETETYKNTGEWPAKRKRCIACLKNYSYAQAHLKLKSGNLQ